MLNLIHDHLRLCRLSRHLNLDYPFVGIGRRFWYFLALPVNEEAREIFGKVTGRIICFIIRVNVLKHCISMWIACLKLYLLALI